MSNINPDQYPLGTLPLHPMEEGARKVLTGPELWDGTYDYEPTRDLDNTPYELLSRTDFLIGVKGARHHGKSHPSERFLTRVLELGLEPVNV